MKTNISKRQFLKYSALGLASVSGAALGRFSFHLAHTALTDVSSPNVLPEGYIDDASRLNLTKVKSIVPIPTHLEEAESQLKRLVKSISKAKGRVALAGAKHTMGGHVITPNGIELGRYAADFFSV